MLTDICECNTMAPTRWLVILAIFSFAFARHCTAIFKMTNVHCESFNASLVVVNHCRLRAVKRDVTIFNMNLTIIPIANAITLKGAFMTKAVGGYKPFVLNFTIDCCDYVKRRHNPIVNLIYPLFREFSNINHSCPYTGEQIITGFYPKHNLFGLNLPNGDYLLGMTWYLAKVRAFETNVYFTFEEVGQQG